MGSVAIFFCAAGHWVACCHPPTKHRTFARTQKNTNTTNTNKKTNNQEETQIKTTQITQTNTNNKDTNKHKKEKIGNTNENSGYWAA